MSGAFTAIDLSRLPAPDAIEQVSYQQTLDEMLSKLQELMPDYQLLESDPAIKVLEIAAYRETLLRQRVNDGVRAVMLAYATGANLDQIAATHNVERLVVEPGNPDAIPPIPPVYESDEALRRRVQLSFEGRSTAGPAGGYIFHALGADSRVLDASVHSPTPGDVYVTVLSSEGDGTPSEELTEIVRATLSSDDIRPLTDRVIVTAATVKPYSIDATLTYYPGPDPAVVYQTAMKSINSFIERNRRLGRDITLSGVISALHVEGVYKVDLASPALDVVVDVHEASFCQSLSVVSGGSNE